MKPATRRLTVDVTAAMYDALTELAALGSAHRGRRLGARDVVYEALCVFLPLARRGLLRRTADAGPGEAGTSHPTKVPA